MNDDEAHFIIGKVAIRSSQPGLQAKQVFDSNIVPIAGALARTRLWLFGHVAQPSPRRSRVASSTSAREPT